MCMTPAPWQATAPTYTITADRGARHRVTGQVRGELQAARLAARWQEAGWITAITPA